MNKQLWARVVERDRGHCFICGGEGGEVHHVVARSQYGKKNAPLFEQEKNLVLLCRRCHSTIRHEFSVGSLLRKLADRYGYQYEDDYAPWLTDFVYAPYITLGRI